MSPLVAERRQKSVRRRTAFFQRSNQAVRDAGCGGLGQGFSVDKQGPVNTRRARTRDVTSPDSPGRHLEVGGLKHSSGAQPLGLASCAEAFAEPFESFPEVRQAREKRSLFEAQAAGVSSAAIEDALRA
jgi:hypothetical protein